MSTPDALIERLRGGVYGLNRIALCEEAAAELRRQHAEIERLRDELNLCCELKREYQQQAAAERERCAKLCESARESIWEFSDPAVKETGRNVCTNLAAAIRGY